MKQERWLFKGRGKGIYVIWGIFLLAFILSVTPGFGQKIKKAKRETQSAQQRLSVNPLAFHHQKVTVKGELRIDTDVYPQGCTFIMEADSRIIVESGRVFGVDNCVFRGCDFLWSGIRVESGGKITLTNTEIRDAVTGVVPEDNSIVTIQKCVFRDNFIGIYVVPDAPLPLATSKPVLFGPFYGNTFEGTGSLLPFSPTTTLTLPPNTAVTLGTQPYCGIYCDRWVMNIGISGFAFNLFHKMNCGIRSVSSQLTVVNSIFKLIHRNNAYTNNAATGDGAGIWATGTPDTYVSLLSQIGYGHSPSSTLSYDDCEEGIWSNNVKVFAAKNHQKRIRRVGFELSGTQAAVEVLQNRIESDWGGIRVTGLEQGVGIKDNHIEVLTPAANALFGISAQGIVSAAPNPPTLFIERDTIYFAQKGGSGILLQSCEQALVVENQIEIGLNFTNSVNPTQFGINAQGGQRHTISCNKITGTHIGDEFMQVAVRVQDHPDSDVSCNSTDNTDIGFLFINQCNNTIWKGNEMHNHYRALSLGLTNAASNPVIGDQFYHGNLWLGTYGDPTAPNPGGGACLMDINAFSAYQGSQFKIDPSSSTAPDNQPEYPGMGINGEIFPLTVATLWFSQSSGTEYDCSQSTCPNGIAPMAMQSSFSEFDSLLASGEWQPYYHQEVSLREAGKALFSRTDSINSGLFANFRDSLQLETNIPEYWEMEASLKELPAADYSPLISLTHDLLNEIKQKDSLMLAYPSDSLLLVSEKQSIIVQLTDLQAEFYAAESAVFESRETQTNTLEASNATLMTNDIASENDKIVNRLILSFQKTAQIDSADIPDLFSVASQCALAGGKSVYRARSLYSLVSDSIFEDITLCPPIGYSLRKAGTQTGSTKTRWVMGSTNKGDTINNMGFTNYDMVFTPDSMYFEVKDRNIYTRATKVTINDSLGNILFYTNGIGIHNALDEVMENGDTLVYCEASTDWAEEGLASPQGAIAIPRPNHPSEYWLFMSIWEGDGYYHGSRLYNSLIDMNENNGLGKVVIKSNVLLDDSLTSPGLNAVKHANGRDWWIIVPQARLDSTNCYHLHLVTPDSILYMGMQYIGGKRTYTAATTFSPDGRWFVCSNGANEVSVFEFDRCRGILTLKDQIHYNPPGYSVGYSTFSPNSRYFYVEFDITSPKLYQYDVLASDINNSEILVWEDLAGFPPQLFVYSKTAPDGKIYSQNYDGKFFNVVNYPDYPGTLCNVQDNGIAKPSKGVDYIPHFPNYTLGPLFGSGCDTLVSISTPYEPNQAEKVKVYPNPASGTVMVEKAKGGTFGLYDIQGRLLLRRVLKSEKETVSLGGLPEGLYIWRVEDLIHGGYETGKVVIQR